MNRVFFAFGIAALCFAGGALADSAQDRANDVLAENAFAKLTRADYDAELSRLGPEMRPSFATDPKRITALLNNLLIAKTLAAQARNEGVDRDPRVQQRIALETDKILAQVEVQRIDEAAGADFDRQASAFVTKARESYVVNASRYRVPEQISASHILFDTKQRSPEAALALARDARAKLLAGADFAALAKELSDDPSAKHNGGALGWFDANRMDPAFTKGAFDLKSAGDLSEPVLSSFGYHLIRLDGRRPAHQQAFDEVKDAIMADLRKSYVNDQRETRLNAIRNDPKMKVNQQAVDALVTPFDPQRFKPNSVVPAAK